MAVSRIRRIFRCRPDRVNGMPVAREIRLLAAVIPSTLFNEGDALPFLLRATAR